MKEIRWNFEKNAWLKKERGVSFEELINATFIGLEKHSSKLHQQFMVVEFRRYAWVIPYVEGEDYFFLKTAFPSRKHTKKYLRGG